MKPPGKQQPPPAPPPPPAPVSPPADHHTFVQFVGPVVVHDTRGCEVLADRAAVGNALGDHGWKVTAIVLAGAWFEVHVEGGAASYRVPMTNVRSARR